MNKLFRVIAPVFAAVLALSMGSPFVANAATTATPSAADCSDLTGITRLVSAKGYSIAGKVPVLFVHGWTGTGKDFSNPVAITSPGYTDKSWQGLDQEVAAIPNVVTFTYDYHKYAGRWVTDTNIYQPLQAAIKCLAEASGNKVIITVHSMGGLATRQALAPSAQSGYVSRVVTFGTPELGSDIATIASGVFQSSTNKNAPLTTRPLAVVQTILAECGKAHSENMNNICPDGDYEYLRNLIYSSPAVPDLETAGALGLRAGKPDIENLPKWPSSGLTINALGGNNTVSISGRSTVFEFQPANPKGAIQMGDTVVMPYSAKAFADAYHQVNCATNLTYRINSLSSNPVDAFINGIDTGLTINNDRVEIGAYMASPCFHGNLMKSIELSSYAIKYITAQAKTESATSSAKSNPDDVLAYDPANPNDMSKWLITTYGMGPLQFGQTANQMQTYSDVESYVKSHYAVGLPHVINEGNMNYICTPVVTGNKSWVEGWFDFNSIESNSTAASSLKSSELAYLDVNQAIASHGGTPKTVEGITVGSSEADFFKAYGTLDSGNYAYLNSMAGSDLYEVVLSPMPVKTLQAYLTAVQEAQLGSNPANLQDVTDKFRDAIQYYKSNGITLTFLKGRVFEITVGNMQYSPDNSCRYNNGVM
jgi:pimeloyl-ACP methyl ester carboxylesterase